MVAHLSLIRLASRVLVIPLGLGKHLSDRCRMDSSLSLTGRDIKTQSSLVSKKTTPQFLESASPKDKKWDGHRFSTDRIEDLYSLNSKFLPLAGRMAKCSTWLNFAESLDRSTGEVKLKLFQATFCHVRHCPVCSWRRTLRNTARFFEKIPELKQQHPTARFLFLTLTVPNCAPGELRSKISEMNKAWKRLIELKSFPAIGWIRTVEVTRSKSGQAHPHFHALLMVPASYFSRGYLSHEKWLGMWQQSMRDESITQVDIRTVKPKIEGQDLHAAVVETLKYSTKVTDAFEDPNWLYVMTEQLHKMRFIASGGILKDILKDSMTDEEMISGDEIELASEDGQAKLMFTWRKEHRKYAFKKKTEPQ